jgi:hypothetical protein
MIFTLQDIMCMIYGPVVKCQYCFVSMATSNVRFSERTTSNRRLLSNSPRIMDGEYRSETGNELSKSEL